MSKTTQTEEKKTRNYGLTKIPNEHYEFIKDTGIVINTFILRAIAEKVKRDSK